MEGRNHAISCKQKSQGGQVAFGGKGGRITTKTKTRAELPIEMLLITNKVVVEIEVQSFRLECVD